MPVKKLLNVIMTPEEIEKVKDSARTEGLSAGEWVRRALRKRMNQERVVREILENRKQRKQKVS